MAENGTDDGMAAVEPGPIARICDAAHAADEGHSSGFCRECAAIALALNVAPVTALLDLLVEQGGLDTYTSWLCEATRDGERVDVWPKHYSAVTHHEKPASYLTDRFGAQRG